MCVFQHVCVCLRVEQEGGYICSAFFQLVIIMLLNA